MFAMDNVDEVYKVLANPVRRQILTWLREPSLHFPNALLPLEQGVSVTDILRADGTFPSHDISASRRHDSIRTLDSQACRSVGAFPPKRVAYSSLRRPSKYSTMIRVCWSSRARQ